MTEYNVKQISEMLEINPETVRRWIRSGKLAAEQSSKKDGNVVTQEALVGFLKSMPKYSGLVGGLVAASAPMIGIPLVMGSLAGGIVTAMGMKKGTKITADYIQNYLSSEVKKLNSSIAKKKDTVKQLQADIEAEEQRIAELTYALENLNLQEIADGINSKR